MANRNNPKGLFPRYSMSGGTIRGEAITLTAANAIIGIGDPLVETNDGLFDRAAASDVVSAVAAASAAASSGATILAYRDPNIVFSAQTDDGSGTSTSQTAVNLNINFIIGNAVNGRSIMELDESSADTTATLPFKIRGLYQSIDNAFGEFNELLVTINNHKDKGGTGTLGV